jgi:hypothetical protein
MVTSSESVITCNNVIYHVRIGHLIDHYNIKNNNRRQ